MGCHGNDCSVGYLFTGGEVEGKNFGGTVLRNGDNGCICDFVQSTQSQGMKSGTLFGYSYNRFIADGLTFF
jgi:hypothetical protein